jgi:hypothetical protein
MGERHRASRQRVRPRVAKRQKVVRGEDTEGDTESGRVKGVDRGKDTE